MTIFNFNGYANRQQQGKFMQIRAVSSYWSTSDGGQVLAHKKEPHENRRWQRKERERYSILTEGVCPHRPLNQHARFNVALKVENQEFQLYTTGINSAFPSREGNFKCDAGEQAAALRQKCTGWGVTRLCLCLLFSSAALPGHVPAATRD